MGVYIILLIFCTLGELLDRSERIPLRTKKKVFIIIIVYMIFFVGCRSTNVGNDSANNLYIFNHIALLSTKQVLSLRPYNLEVGYLLLVKAISCITKNGAYLFIIVALVDFICIGKWIWKEGDRPFISLFIFTCVFIPFFLTGLRQSLALSIVLCSILCLKKKKTVKFVILVLFASLFHVSALIALAYIPISRIKNTKMYMGIITLSFIIAFLFRTSLFELTIRLFSNSRYADYTVLNQGAPTTYIILLFILAFIGFTIDMRTVTVTHTEDEVSSISEYNIMVTSIPILALVTVNGSLMRVAMYFSIFMCLWVPSMYVRIRQRNIRVMVIVFSLAILAVMFLNNIATSKCYLYEFIGLDKLMP